MKSQTVRVADLVADGILRVEDGNHGEYRPRPHEFVDDGVPFIRAADMSAGVVEFGRAGRINAEARARIRKGIGLPGDVLLSHKGTVGKIAVAPSDAPDFVCSPQTTFWRSLRHDRLDQRYLRCYMDSEPFQRQLRVLMGQTDMAPYVSLTDQRSLLIVVPGIAEQQAIAEVLGALDDKIGANARQADALIALADAEFARRAWGLPSSERSFAEVASVGGGGTPNTKVDEYWGGDVSWATPTDVTGLQAPYLRGTARSITQAGLDACASRLYPAGSILMTSRATIGAFALAEVPVAVNQGFIVVNAGDPALQMWLFHEMRSRLQEFLAHANGATFLELSRGRFKALPVRLADDATVSAFSTLASALHAKGAALMKENGALAHVRDNLLPLLMSGRVRVRDAEKSVEGVV